MHGDLTVTVSEASSLVGVGKTPLRRMLKDGRLEGFISPAGRRMRISIASLAETFGLQAEEVYQAVAERRDSQRYSDGQSARDSNGLGSFVYRPAKPYAASGMRPRNASQRNAIRQVPPSGPRASTSPHATPDELTPAAKALLASAERSYQRAREQYHCAKGPRASQDDAGASSDAAL